MVSGNFVIGQGQDGWREASHLIVKSRGLCVVARDIMTHKQSVQRATRSANWEKRWRRLALE